MTPWDRRSFPVLGPGHGTACLALRHLTIDHVAAGRPRCATMWPRRETGTHTAACGCSALCRRAVPKCPFGPWCVGVGARSTPPGQGARSNGVADAARLRENDRHMRWRMVAGMPLVARRHATTATVRHMRWRTVAGMPLFSGGRGGRGRPQPRVTCPCIRLQGT